ncbi:hypothetical protein MyNCGM683_06730 [Achromobacter xylosoxidans]
MRDAARALLDRLTSIARSIDRTFRGCLGTREHPAQPAPPQQIVKLDATSTHALNTVRTLCNHLLSIVGSPNACAGLFRACASPNVLVSARQTIHNGQALDASTLSPAACGNLIKEGMRGIWNASISDLQRAATHSLNLPAGSSVADISAALDSQPGKARATFNSALMAQIHSKLAQSLQNDEKKLSIAKDSLMTLGSIYNAAPTDIQLPFNKTSMACGFNVIGDVETKDSDAASILAAMKEVELALPIFWSAIGDAAPIESTNL